MRPTTVSRFLLCGGLICTISMSSGHHRSVSWQDVPGWMLPMPLWLLLQWQCTDRANWTMQSRSDSTNTAKKCPENRSMKLYLYGLIRPSLFHPTQPFFFFFLLRCVIVLFNTGYFCSLGSSEPSPTSRPYGNVCPVGHFCPEGGGSPRPCPVGSFLPESGASALSQCHPCPPGQYCLSPGSSQPTGGWERLTWYYINYSPLYQGLLYKFVSLSLRGVKRGETKWLSSQVCVLLAFSALVVPVPPHPESTRLYSGAFVRYWIQKQLSGWIICTASIIPLVIMFHYSCTWLHKYQYLDLFWRHDANYHCVAISVRLFKGYFLS